MAPKTWQFPTLLKRKNWFNLIANNQHTLNATETCPLCANVGSVFYKSEKQIFFQCSECSGLFVSPSLLPTADFEIERYKQHRNDENDLEYQKFVSPITQSIFNDFNAHHAGLDFGAGTSSPITKVLSDAGYQISPYDPFFIPSKHLLSQKYDYIACCEVIEHFHHPKREFQLLKNLLHEGGKLYCMTHLFDESIPFSNWYYKNDPTHVFIYREKTLHWIKSHFNFKKLEINNRLIVFED